MTDLESLLPAAGFAGEVRARVGPPLVVGPVAGGERRIVPILGGTLVGPGIAGEILPGGADVQRVRGDGATELVARYAVRLEGGAVLFVVNRGLRCAAPEDAAALLRGEAVPPERVYFRCTPVFETASPDHAWMTRSVFLGFGERHPAEVRIRIHAV